MDKNTSFQLMALNWLLQTGDMERFIVENVDKSCFASPYQEIFESIKSYYDIHHKTPSKEYIAGLHQDFVSVIIEDPIETLLPYLKNVSAYYDLKNLQDWMFGPNAFPDNLLSEEKFIEIYDIIDKTYQEKRADFLRRSVSKPPHSMNFSDMKDQYLKSEPPVMIDTGFVDLRLRSDDGVMVIGASTGVGKTFTLIKIAVEQAEKGKKVLFFGKEVPVIPTTERLLAYALHCPVDEITYRLKKIPDELDLNIIYMDHEQEKISTVSDIKKAIMYYNPDVVLFDDVTYITPDGWDGIGKKDYEKTAAAMVDLRMMHHQTGVPLIVTDQLTKECGKYTEPEKAALSGSKTVSDTSTLVVLLYRKDDKTIVKCCKDRFGDSDGLQFVYSVDYSTCTWTYLGLYDDVFKEESVESLCDEAMKQKKIEYDWHNKNNYFTHQDVVDGKADGIKYIRGKYPDGKEISTQPEKVKSKLIRQFDFKPTNIF